MWVCLKTGHPRTPKPNGLLSSSLPLKVAIWGPQGNQLGPSLTEAWRSWSPWPKPQCAAAGDLAAFGTEGHVGRWQLCFASLRAFRTYSNWFPCSDWLGSLTISDWRFVDFNLHILRIPMQVHQTSHSLCSNSSVCMCLIMYTMYTLSIIKKCSNTGAVICWQYHMKMYVCMYACMYVCMYACMYVCMHV